MIRITLALTLTLIAGTPGRSEFLTYAQWERETHAVRGAYVAGLFDGLVGFGVSDTDTVVGQHYFGCIVRTRMTNVQLAENVLQFARARPEMQRGSLLAPLLNYLIALCGKPPG